MSTEPEMRFEIRRAANGWILKTQCLWVDPGDPDELVCQEEYDDEVDCFAGFLWSIDEHFGPSTSRYSPKRIVVRVEPGDKFER